MDHTNMKEQENLRLKTVPEVLAFLFEVTDATSSFYSAF